MEIGYKNIPLFAQAAIDFRQKIIINSDFDHVAHNLWKSPLHFVVMNALAVGGVIELTARIALGILLAVPALVVRAFDNQAPFVKFYVQHTNLLKAPTYLYDTIWRVGYIFGVSIAQIFTRMHMNLTNQVWYDPSGTSTINLAEAAPLSLASEKPFSFAAFRENVPILFKDAPMPKVKMILDHMSYSNPLFLMDSTTERRLGTPITRDSFYVAMREYLLETAIQFQREDIISYLLNHPQAFSSSAEKRCALALLKDDLVQASSILRKERLQHNPLIFQIACYKGHLDFANGMTSDVNNDQMVQGLKIAFYQTNPALFTSLITTLKSGRRNPYFCSIGNTKYRTFMNDIFCRTPLSSDPIKRTHQISMQRSILELDSIIHDVIRLLLIDSGNLEFLSNYLENHPHHPDRLTLLLEGALRKNKIEVARFLISRGANPKGRIHPSGFNDAICLRTGLRSHPETAVFISTHLHEHLSDYDTRDLFEFTAGNLDRAFLRGSLEERPAAVRQLGACLFVLSLYLRHRPSLETFIRARDQVDSPLRTDPIHSIIPFLAHTRADVETRVVHIQRRERAPADEGEIRGLALAEQIAVTSDRMNGAVDFALMSARNFAWFRRREATIAWTGCALCFIEARPDNWLENGF